MTGAGGLVEVQGTAEGAPFSEEDFLRLHDAGAHGHPPARRPAEARGALSAGHAADARPARRRQPQSGKGARDRRPARPFGFDVKSAAELGLPEPEETGTTFEENAILKARAAARGLRHAGARRRFRAGGRCARRRARHLFGALGRADQGFRASPCARSRTRCRRRRRHAGAAPRAFRLRAGARHARRRGRDLRRPRRRHARLAAARRSRASATTRCSCPTATTRTFGEMSAEEKHGWRPGQREALSHRARAFTRFARRVPGARMSAHRSRESRDRFRHLRPLALLRRQVPLLRFQLARPPCAARRAALRRRLRARARPFRGADARPHRHQHLPRRRHALADAAGDGRRDPRCDRAALARSRPMPRSRSRPIPAASRRSAFAAIAPPA